MESLEVDDAPNREQPLSIKCITWYRDSHGLFDFESRQYSYSPPYQFLDSGVLRLCDGDRIVVVPPSSGPPNERDICSVVHMNGSYYAYHKKGLQLKSDFREQIWQVIKTLPKNAHGFSGHKLTRGDIVKLGRLALTVREICVAGSVQAA